MAWSRAPPQVLLGGYRARRQRRGGRGEEWGPDRGPAPVFRGPSPVAPAHPLRPLHPARMHSPGEREAAAASSEWLSPARRTKKAKSKVHRVHAGLPERLSGDSIQGREGLQDRRERLCYSEGGRRSRGSGRHQQSLPGPLRVSGGGRQAGGTVPGLC